jgi:peptidoglycan/LPS O-acetylase OafA/YrhL
MASSLPGAKVASEISYSLYLVHPLVFSVTFERLRLLGVTGVTATSLVLSVALAWGMRRAIEMPLLRVRDRETFGGIGLSPGGANGNEAIVRSVPRRP